MTRIKKNLKKIIIITVAALLLINGWLIWENKSLTVTEYTVASERLPEGFSGFRIAQVSDLHNTEFGANNKRLISRLEEINPDIIVITGDLIDSRRTNIDVAVSFAEQAIKIAPTYYVTGNHEARLDASEYEDMTDKLRKVGVTVLEYESILLQKNGDSILLIGLEDPNFSVDVTKNGFWERPTNDNLNRLSDPSVFTLLLTHRPEYFHLYVKYDIDIALAGHAHGGQIRLPFVGGVFVPNQGFFPTYDAGVFTEDGTTMIISRGLGNSRALIPRINNRPEIVVVELIKEN